MVVVLLSQYLQSDENLSIAVFTPADNAQKPTFSSFVHICFVPKRVWVLYGDNVEAFRDVNRNRPASPTFNMNKFYNINIQSDGIMTITRHPCVFLNVSLLKGHFFVTETHEVES